MVPVEHAEIGTELEIERPGETLAGVVANRVLLKPEHAEQALGPSGPRRRPAAVQ